MAKVAVLLRPRRSQGLTLIEVTVVLLVLAGLAIMGAPVLWKEIAKARRTEAITTLAAIQSHQSSYRFETGLYGDTFDEIGFALPSGMRIDERTLEGNNYTFTVSALPMNGVDRANFQAIATGDLDPRDATLDILIIENALTVVEGAAPEENSP
jgi:type II secretory pathway pseudopilin PulG